MQRHTPYIPAADDQAERAEAEGGDTADVDARPPSKSQRKRESTALQDLGVELVALSRDQLKRIELPDNLRAAIRDCQRFTAHGAVSRQMQYIGKLMRGIDPAPVRAVLDEINGVSAAANARQHALEQLRTRLLGDEAVLGEITQSHPSADITHLRQLRRNALKEQQLGKPPRAFRELFRQLRELQESTREPNDAAATDE
jgi:ribosome-associated protein